MSAKRTPTRRAVKFWIINRLLLPAGLLVLRLLVLSWRLDRRGAEQLRQVIREHDRLLVATWHGMFFALMPYARVMAAEGRNATIMTSPSRDGQVLDAAIRAIGLRVVKGSSRSRASAGSFALVNEIEEGHVGLLAVDGPRGPAAVPKPGFIRIARASRAHVVSIAVGSRHAIRFRTWDRLFLPLPFSSVSIRVRPFTIPEPGEPEAQSVEALRQQMVADAGRVVCPIISRRVP